MSEIDSQAEREKFLREQEHRRAQRLHQSSEVHHARSNSSLEMIRLAEVIANLLWSIKKFDPDLAARLCRIELARLGDAQAADDQPNLRDVLTILRELAQEKRE